MQDNRDAWRLKCQDAERMQQEAEEGWKAEQEKNKTLLQALQETEGEKTSDSNAQIDNSRRPAGHVYELWLINICILLVTKASLSFRAVRSVLEIFSDLIPKITRIPAVSTIRLWLLKFGLFKTSRLVEIASDWALILDHTIQIGKLKVLIVLGIRLKNLPENRALTLSDLEPLLVLPMYRSTGTQIADILSQLQAKLGVIKQLSSDEGSDIKAGIKIFTKNSPWTIWIPDLIHKLAHLLNKELTADPNWLTLCSKASKARTRLLQTCAAHLIPPQRRDKARYLNLEELIKWATRILLALDGNSFPKEERDLIMQEFGWLLDLRESIEEYRQLWLVLATAKILVRNNGIDIDTPENLIQNLLTLSLGARANQFAFRVVEFVMDQADKADVNDRFLGTSEIIESLIGSLKHHLRAQSRSSFTASCLLAGALVGKHDEELVLEAMESLTHKKIQDWTHQHIGETVQGKRKKFFTMAKVEEKALIELKFGSKSGNSLLGTLEA